MWKLNVNCTYIHTFLVIILMCFSHSIKAQEVSNEIIVHPSEFVPSPEQSDPVNFAWPNWQDPKISMLAYNAIFSADSIAFLPLQKREDWLTKNDIMAFLSGTAQGEILFSITVGNEVIDMTTGNAINRLDFSGDFTPVSCGSTDDNIDHPIQPGSSVTLSASGNGINGVSCSACYWQYCSDVTVTKIVYKPYLTNSDLIAWPISIPNINYDPTDGWPIIPVGVPTQINVPVSLNYTGTLTPEQLSSFVPVTLQVGSYTATQYVSIADLTANQNNLIVPFTVNFATQDVGPQNLSVTVNPNNTFAESSYQNNSTQQWVHVVVSKYKIVKFISINGVLKESDTISISPSKEEGCRSINTSKAQIVLRCFKEIPGSIVDEVVDGCKIKTSLELSTFLGAHETGHDQSTRPMGTFSPNTNIDYVNIPKTGLTVNYTASEVAGGYIVNFDALDSDGNSIVDVKETLFRVETQTFFLPFTGIPGLRFQNLDSHRSDDMVWGAPKLQRDVEAAVRTYFFRANNHPVIGSPDYIFNIFDNPNISPIYSEGISLKYGGMFDVDKHWRMLNPDKGHCLHRRGIDIDFSLSTFNNRFRTTLMRIWAESIRDKALVMREINEKPEDPDSNHWHAQLKTN